MMKRPNEGRKALHEAAETGMLRREGERVIAATDGQGKDRTDVETMRRTVRRTAREMGDWFPCVL